MHSSFTCGIDEAIALILYIALCFQIEKAVSEDELQRVFESNFDWFIDQGMVVYGKKLENKQEILRNIFKNAIFYRFVLYNMYVYHHIEL